MTMQRHDYPNIGETLYSAELPNGLRLRVVPKKGFATFYARLRRELRRSRPAL